VVVGSNFHFGHRACGDVATLRQIGEAHGFAVVGHDLLELDGDTVSSTRIRTLIAAGDVLGAARLLGRSHRLSGTVMEGRRQGRELGFPTANVHPLPHMAIPADGVYAGRVSVHDRLWPAAIAVGRPPTFADALPFVECHLIGFAGDLYNLDIEVEFVERIREQRRFESLDELTSSIASDVARARALLGV
jgi:riboflavin kinase/FMN adenylyltransferase